MRKRILAVLMALAMVAVCAACGKKEEAVDYTTAEGISGATVVAEQESAGETVIAEDAFFDKAEYTACLLYTSLVAPYGPTCATAVFLRGRVRLRSS